MALRGLPRDGVMNGLAAENFDDNNPMVCC
jgi:hypothetical protein